MLEIMYERMSAKDRLRSAKNVVFCLICVLSTGQLGRDYSYSS